MQNRSKRNHTDVHIYRLNADELQMQQKAEDLATCTVDFLQNKDNSPPAMPSGQHERRQPAAQPVFTSFMHDQNGTLWASDNKAFIALCPANARAQLLREKDPTQCITHDLMNPVALQLLPECEGVDDSV